MGYAFISYKSEEQSKADALRNIFINNGIDCWMDVYNIPAGTIWRRKINNTIESNSCSCFVLVLTELSQSSENILDEIAAAKDTNKPIIPVRFGSFKLNSDMRSYLRRLQIEDVESVDETDAGMKKVLEAVKNLAGVKESEKKQQKENVVEKKQIAQEVTSEKEKASDIVTVVDRNGWKYVGQMKGRKYHGKGTLYYPGGSEFYEGDWVDGKRHGTGTSYYFGDDRYEGDWVHDKCHGKGTRYYLNGDRYEGEWENNERNGWGTYYYADGRTEERYYENDELKEVK